jgi:methionyl-tRNA synthetase
MSESTFYVTTPIYYANARPHLGHLYTTLVADSLTRFKRQRGIDSFFLTGSDEHGVNIERAAAAAGIPVREHVDRIVKEFQETFASFQIEYDHWIRTTDPSHEAAVQKLWLILKERGYIYKGRYEGWFCGYCNEFKDIEASRAQPVCPDHERPLDRVSEESYFFKLSEFERPLLQLYESRPDFIRPEARRNEVISFVSGGLKDLSISRASVRWGIPVPDDPEHTIYVWLDALSNYITALGWGSQDDSKFRRYWPALHLIGKDILRFHAVYWPAFLMAAGIELPRSVFAHGMWLSGGRKMSKTLGNVIELDILRRHFAPDLVRYFILREKAFWQDGDFTYESLIDRTNADLANGIGNLSSRTLTMVKNYFGGRPPRPGRAAIELQQDVPELIEWAKERFDREFDSLNFSRALEAAWSAIARVDKFITDTRPWLLAKDPGQVDQLEAVIATAYEALRHIVLILAPVIPEASRQIWRQMGLAGDPLQINPAQASWGEDIEISTIREVKPVLPKLHRERIMSEINKERAGLQGAQPTTPPRETITIEDFAKVDLRVATVLEAERVPKADKLLRLIVDVGEEKPRQIVAGIAEHYSPGELIGRKIIIVANLAPRTLRGIESNGMLLAATTSEGRPVIATFTEDVPNGARLK